MRFTIPAAATCFALALTVRVVGTQQPSADPQAADQQKSSTMPSEVSPLDATVTSSRATEAPTGFDLTSNGFLTPEEFAEALEEFTGPETVADGLGPVFNAAGCGECHVMPVIGGSSQIFERRAGLFVNGVFTEHPGGSLIQDRATDPSVQETVLPGFANVIAFRSSLSILGDGFVEAIANSTLADIRDSQPFSLRGLAVPVPVLEAPGQTRIGRFGWKGQQASLLSFAADAYKNEMGITSPLQPEENSVNGQPFPPELDPIPGEPAVTDDDGDDVGLFAAFMRATKAPPVDALRAATPEAQRGSQVFSGIGCATCHTRTIITAPPGTLINGGAFVVPLALGDKIIHPFSDFLLHDINTGDGIVQNGGPQSRLRLRTPPLWGLRARGRFMHDGESQSPLDAILRHGGQAASIRNNFLSLRRGDRDAVIAFLLSL